MVSYFILAIMSQPSAFLLEFSFNINLAFSFDNEVADNFKIDNL